jgi:hypothetical protein
MPIHGSRGALWLVLIFHEQLREVSWAFMFRIRFYIVWGNRRNSNGCARPYVCDEPKSRNASVRNMSLKAVENETDTQYRLIGWKMGTRAETVEFLFRSCELVSLKVGKSVYCSVKPSG